VLYQLSYIGPKTQLPAFSQTLLRVFVRMQHIVTPQPALYREQCEDRECDSSYPRVTNREPGKDAKHDVGD
jgi:hypothetical protein